MKTDHFIDGLDECVRVLEERRKQRETGYIYCPYIPLMTTRDISLKDFKPRDNCEFFRKIDFGYIKHEII